MPYLAGDRSMKVKLKCPCVRALKGKVVSVLSIVGPGQAGQASAPHSSPWSHPRPLWWSPLLTLTSGPGKVECQEERAVPAASLFGQNMWTGQRRDSGGTGCDVLTWHGVHYYLWPGLAWQTRLSWRGCHVTWHGAWQGIEHRQAPGICFISVAGCWAPVSGIQWPPVLCTSPAPAGWGPSAQPITARDPLGQPMRARAGSMPLYGSWSWSEWVMAWPAVWTSGWCWLQGALLSVPGPGLAGARSEGSIC